MTIEDNDLPRVSVSTDTATADEDKTLRFTLTREGVTDDRLTVNVRVTETRQMLGSGQPTIATFDAGVSRRRWTLRSPTTPRTRTTAW